MDGSKSDSNQNTNTSGPSVVKRFFHTYISRHMVRFSMSVVLMIVVAVCSAGLAYIVKNVIDNVFVEKQMSKVVEVSIFVFIISVIKFVASFTNDTILVFLKEKVALNLRYDLFQSLVNIEMKVMKKITQKDIHINFSNDITSISNSLKDLMITFGRELISVIFLFLLLLFKEPVLTFASMISFVFIILPIKNFARSIRKKTRTEKKMQAEIVSHVLDVISGIRTIKISNSEERKIRSFYLILMKIFKVSYKNESRQNVSSYLVEFISTIGACAAILIGGKSIVNGSKTVGDFMMFLTVLVSVYKPAKNVASVGMKLQTCVTSLERFFYTLDMNIKHAIKNKASIKKIEISSPLIEFKNVYFDYDNDTLEQSFIKDLNLTIQPKTKVAFVGLSGGGKSTIVNLIPRFFDIKHGSISINNVDIRDLNITFLRRNISYVGQDLFLFNDTILNNIKYASKRNFSMSEIHDVIKMVKADFIYDLEDGIHTMIGSDGVQFSTGQKQRLSIAMALIKKAKIVIFDEITSSLDAITEQNINSKIFEYLKDSTIITVAHRLSTITNYDKIHMVMNGDVVASGTHSELIDSSEEYGKLFNTYSRKS